MDGSTTKKTINTGDLVPNVSIGARKDLTDRRWRRLEPLLPCGERRGRPPKWSRRQQVDGIRWRTRVGAPWRDVPERYGHRQSVYHLFRRWQRAGIWAFIWAKPMAFADAAGLIVWSVSVDSTIKPCPPARRRCPPRCRRAGRTAGRRATRSRAGALARWPDHQDPPSVRAGPQTDGGSGHRRSARRQPAVPAGAVRVARSGRGGRAPVRTGFWPTRPIPPRPTALICAVVGSRPPFR